MSGQITPEDERKLVLATLLKSGSADGREDIRRYWRQRLDVLAAAPELLAVCKELEAHLRVETPETRGNPVAHAAEGRALRERMNAAINRAEGR